MVTRYGMSKELGPRTFGKREELVFLGKEIIEQRDYSDSVAQTIDEEVHSLIDRAYQTAKNLLTTNKAKLTQVAKYLIENESVEDEALQGLFDSPTPGLPDAAPAG
jgi:cell division protease FtsH